jgi:hypothetical protein
MSYRAKNWEKDSLKTKCKEIIKIGQNENTSFKCKKEEVYS